MNIDRIRHPVLEYSFWSIIVVSALIGIRVFFGYAVFHTAVEFFAISVAVGTFMITWNARRYIDNGYLVFLGIAYFLVAIVDGLHTMSYRGVELFAGYSPTELPTQLWLVGRYLQAIALVIAPAFIGKRIRGRIALASFGAFTLAMLVLVFSGNFPSAFPENEQLTQFKILSEWFIIAAFTMGLIGLIRGKDAFDRQVYLLLTGSIVASIVGEFAFTLYATPYAIENLVGHMVRILAAYLLYRAIIETGIRRPYAVLFHELTETSEQLKASEVRFRSTFEQATVGIGLVSMDGHVLEMNQRGSEIIGRSLEQLEGVPASEITYAEDLVAEKALIARLNAGEISEAHLEKRYVRPDGSLVWVSTVRSVVRNDSGEPLYYIMIAEDITERRLAEERLQHGHDLSDALNAIDRAINSTFDLDEVLRRVTSLGTAVIGADAATVWMKNENHWTPRLAHGLPDLIVGKLFTDQQVPHVAEAIRLNEPLSVNDLAASYPDAAFSTAPNHTTVSALVVPLQFRSEHFGALVFAWKHSRDAFPVEEMDFARKLGSALALAMENTRLYAGERRVADTLQSSMLRTDAQLPGVDIGWAYRSATDLARIGGDFFDLFQLPDGRIAFVIGDVAGKGIEAAAVTYIAKSTLRAFAYEVQEPAQVARAANQALLHQMEEEQFITILYGVLDCTVGRATIVCAGHPQPLVCTDSGCTVREETSNPPLGVFGHYDFETFDVDLPKGSRLVMYSDGLLDARNGSEFFGETRVRQLIDKLGDADPKPLVDALMTASQEFADGNPGDDIAIVALRNNTTGNI